MQARAARISGGLRANLIGISVSPTTSRINSAVATSIAAERHAFYISYTRQCVSCRDRSLCGVYRRLSKHDLNRGSGHHLHHDLPNDEVIRPRGARCGGVEQVRPVVGCGILLDTTLSNDGAALAATASVNRAEIEAIAAREGVEIKFGDIVPLHTGWLPMVDNDPVQKYRKRRPGRKAIYHHLTYHLHVEIYRPVSPALRRRARCRAGFGVGFSTTVAARSCYGRDRSARRRTPYRRDVGRTSRL